jgi:ParB family transcriptional regulator, chromosome partitioning protein
VCWFLLFVRPSADGGYELISGHRRKHACELADLPTMPVIVRNPDNDAATIIMVDSNIQCGNILPSKRAKAYKMKLEAMKRQAGRPSRKWWPTWSPFTRNKNPCILSRGLSG